MDPNTDEIPTKQDILFKCPREDPLSIPKSILCNSLLISEGNRNFHNSLFISNNKFFRQKLLKFPVPNLQIYLYLNITLFLWFRFISSFQDKCFCPCSELYLFLSPMKSCSNTSFSLCNIFSLSFPIFWLVHSGL